MGHSENSLHLCDNPAKEAGNLKSQTNPSRGAFFSWFVTGLESLKEATSHIADEGDYRGDVLM